MYKLLLRLLINAVALWAAITFVPGISGPIHGFEGIGTLGYWVSLLGLAFVFGLVNALIRPLIELLTCPLIILTLGLGTLLINTLMLWLTSVASQWLNTSFGWNIGFVVEDFWAAFFGALVISIVSIILSLFLKGELEGRRRPKPKNN